MSSTTAPVTRRPNPWWVGVVSGMASYIDAAAIVANGIALVIYQHTIGITPDQIGILSGILIFCIAVGALVGGRLGDTFGRRSVFMITMAMIVAGSALMVFGLSFPLLVAGVILIGLGTGADLPVSLATIAEAADDKNRGAIIGLSNILWIIGIVATVLIATFAGGLGLIGGQLLYAHIGVVSLILLLLRIALPESPSWLKARDERKAGIKTIRADKASFKDLLRGDYLKPFIALLSFYALTNLAVGTSGSFSTYIAVNVAGVPVEVYSGLTLLGFPIGIVAGIWFMRIVDTKHRMAYFVLGAFCLVASFLVPAILGFTMVTMVTSLVLNGIGGAFAFEGIMKVWSQESFPTMLRSTAQGSIIAVARFLAAALAVVTPGLINAGAQTLYFGLAGVMAAGLAIAWWAFRGVRRTEFDIEGEPDPDAVSAAQA